MEEEGEVVWVLAGQGIFEHSGCLLASSLSPAAEGECVGEKRERETHGTEAVVEEGGESQLGNPLPHLSPSHQPHC